MAILYAILIFFTLILLAMVALGAIILFFIIFGVVCFIKNRLPESKRSRYPNTMDSITAKHIAEIEAERGVKYYMPQQQVCRQDNSYSAIAQGFIMGYFM